MRTRQLACLAGGLISSSAFAADLHVPADYPTIAAALAAVPVASNSTIYIAGGTYYEHSLALPVPNSSANLKLVGELHTDGTPAVTIDGQGNGPLLSLEISYPSSCEDIIGSYQIQNVHLTGGVPYQWDSGSVLSISSFCTGYGGNVHAEFNNCQFASNSGDLILFSVDGLSFLASVQLLNCVVQGNSDQVGNVSNGGEGYTAISLTDTVVCGNESGSGGQVGAGVFIGSGCSITPDCPVDPITGGCCVPSGCTQLEELPCTALGGNWLGADTACDACPASCAGDTNTDGLINITDLLNMLGQWGVCP